MPSPAEGSLPVSERLPVLDILRGFALLGILIMNMPGFGASFFVEADGSFLWKHPVDRLAEQAREALFSGKFNSMFSMLFGIGFTIQYQRMRERDPAGADVRYLQRLGVLLAFGIIHACVFWPGDVLHVYAVLGFVALFGLRRVSDRGIVALIVACLLYPAVSGVLRVLFITPAMTAARVKLDQSYEASGNLAFGSGGFLDAMAENARIMAYFYGDAISLWGTFGWYVSMLLTLLIGLLAGRRRWAQRVPELLPRIRRLTWVALALGLGCALAYTLIFQLNRAPGPSPIKVVGSVCYSLSRVSMMLFYVLVIVRLSQHPVWQRRLAPLAAAGRMPLTNYLMQTAICITLFQAWGFGLWMKLGPAAWLALSFFIFFAIQAPWSVWWLRTHERGPLEALWARVTYGARKPAPAVA